MKLARYIGQGVIEVQEANAPTCPTGGVLVQTEASGLCSGELMDWYLDRKINHVLGHEVSGLVLESRNDKFEPGRRVFVHHHAPCLQCVECRRGAYVHCAQWKRSRLEPGGMAEQFAAGPDNMTDSFVVTDLDAVDAALIEPVACVAKSISRARTLPGDRIAVIGVGSLGLAHMLALRGDGFEPIGYELKASRTKWAQNLGFDCRAISEIEPAEVVFVCPGSEDAVRLALEIGAPGARIILFAPLPPGQPMSLDLCQLYFQDFELITAYSCGPEDTRTAYRWLQEGRIQASQIVSDFITINELPRAYEAMKAGDILKAMVVFA